jgi:hypothetical protein
MQNTKLLAFSLLLILNTLTAHATLYSTDGGIGVYDNGINATFTSNANLLGTMEGTPSAYGYANESGLITAIIDANVYNGVQGVIQDTPNSYDNYGSGQYKLSATVDFGANGLVTWWGAQAFVNYLDTLNNGQGYGNSNQWTLPMTIENPNPSGYAPPPASSPIAELFYNELGGVPITGNSIEINSLFTNQQTNLYWSGTEYSPGPYNAWNFNTGNGSQGITDKTNLGYAWAISTNPAFAPVPLPGGVWLFGSILAGFSLFGQHRKAA